MKAKDTSHIGMIIGGISLTVVFIIALVKFYKDAIVPSVEQVKALILLGIAPSIPFCPVYISTWFDKIIELKNGKKPETISVEELDDIR